MPHMVELVRRCTENLLISITICFILGASLASTLAASPVGLPLALIVVPLLLAPVLAAYFLSPRLRLLTTLPFFFLVGLLHTHLALQPSSDPHHIASRITAKTKATVVGRIHTMVEYDGEKSRFELATEAILVHAPDRKSAFQPVRGKVKLSVPEDLSARFVPGMKIMAIATMDRVHNYQTPGAFDYRLLMATKSIDCLGWVRSAKEILPVEEPPFSTWQRLRHFPEQIRQRVMLFFSSRFEPEVAGLYQALLIGSMVNISPQLLEAFKENGVMHVLSISGLHLSLLGLFTVTILIQLFKRSQWLLLHSHVPTLGLVLTAPLLLLYTFIAGMNIPAIRSLVTALLVLFAVVVRRQRSLTHLIAAAALIVLAISPLALFTASFQLSFGAVLAINWIYPRLPLVIARPDPSTASNLVTKTIGVVQSMVYVSLAATAGTLPFMLYHFNQFSLIGPLMNLIIEPLLCLWALPCGLLAIPFIGIAPEMATLISTLGSGGIRLTIWLAKTVAGFPYASIWTITPSLVEIALFFVILFLLLHQGQTVRRLSLALVLTTFLLASFTLSLWYPGNNREMIVSFLDVGQGSSALLQLPNGKNILVDGGGHQTERFDPGQALIAPFLWRKRIWRLDDLLITHPHQDHYNGLPFVYAHFQPRRLVVNGDSGDEPAYGQFLEIVRKKGTLLQVTKAGDRLQEGHGLLLDCLGMNGLGDDMGSWSTNDRSLVYRAQFGAHSFLFPGDIGLRSENRLALQGKLPRTTVLLAPHHGSATSTGPDLMEALQPSLIVVSAGPASQGTLPAPAHLREWQQKKLLALLTAKQGTMSCVTDGKTLRVTTFTGDRYLLDEQGGIMPQEK